MPNIQLVEEKESKLPLFCIYGDEEFLQQHLVNQITKKFRIIVISSKKPTFLETLPEIYFLTYQDATLLPKIEETIDYALVLLAGEKAATFLSPVMSKFSLDKTTVLFTIDVFALVKNLEVIREHKSNPNVRISLLGELLVQKEGSQKGQLSKIIENVLSNHTIDLHGDNLSSIYPISVKDAISGILRLLLGNYKNGIMHFLFYKNPETILAFSHVIARIDPDIKINFSDEKTNSLTISRDEIKSILVTRLQIHDAYMDTAFEGFEKAITPILEGKELLQDTTKEGNLSKRSKKAKRRKKLIDSFRFTILSLFFGTFLFLFINLLCFGLGLLYLRQVVQDIKSDNFRNVEKNARISNYFLAAIKPTTNITFEIIGNIDAFQKLTNSYMFIQKAGELSRLTGTTMITLFNGNILSEPILATLTSNLSFLYQEGQRVTLETGNKDIAANLKQTYSKLLSLSEILPTILGFREEKNYLFLFQNNEELRPTGGFIGSIGDAVVKNGKIESLTIQDVYELDGQLRNHIEPPYIVRRYLQPHLYLRDSNFSLNFQESASMSAFLYNLETGKKPDAVIAVDLEVLKEILKLSGPIKLPTYNVTVTSDTVSDFIQSTIKENFFPGSTQKRDILNNLFTQLILKTTTDSKFYIKIAKLIPDLLERKDILISFSDNSVQKAFSANGYGGEYKDSRVSNTKNINDFLYINEANIGANKVNAYISREVTYEAMLEQGRVASKAKLRLTNTSHIDGYKVYIKFAVPKGSILKEISINGVKQQTTSAVTDFRIYEARNFKKSEKLEVEQYTKDNFTYFAFVTEVLKAEKADIEITYDNGVSKPLSTIVDYSLLYIKQPGTKPYQVTTVVDYPEGYIPVNTSADSFGKNFLEQTTIATKDFQNKIEIQKASVQK